jgi:hypothetical protein
LLVPGIAPLAGVVPVEPEPGVIVIAEAEIYRVLQPCQGGFLFSQQRIDPSQPVGLIAIGARFIE